MQQRHDLAARPRRPGTLPQDDEFVGCSFDTKCLDTGCYQDQTSISHRMVIIEKDLKPRRIMR